MNKKVYKSFAIVFLLLLTVTSCINNQKEFLETSSKNVVKKSVNESEKDNDDVEKTTATSESELENSLILDLENKLDLFPHIDGSTANIPLMAQIMSDYLDIDLEIAKNLTSKVSTTDVAWENLIDNANRSKDKSYDEIVIAYEPSEQIKREINRSKNKLRIVPIGVDGFVFLRNKNNRVNNLTIKDIQDIYSAKKTNWKELGGDDINIEAYQRIYNSGSQTLFLKLVMKDVKPTQVEKEYELGEMGGVFTTLSRYDNTANAIGYSVFYYADKMLDYPNLDFFKINGVYPSDKTIEDGTYELRNEYYMAIMDDADENSLAHKLYEYILSDKGQESIRKAGYIPVKEHKEFNTFE